MSRLMSRLQVTISIFVALTQDIAFGKDHLNGAAMVYSVLTDSVGWDRCSERSMFRSNQKSNQESHFESTSVR